MRLRRRISVFTVVSVFFLVQSTRRVVSVFVKIKMPCFPASPDGGITVYYLRIYIVVKDTTWIVTEDCVYRTYFSYVLNCSDLHDIPYTHSTPFDLPPGFSAPLMAYLREMHEQIHEVPRDFFERENPTPRYFNYEFPAQNSITTGIKQLFNMLGNVRSYGDAGHPVLNTLLYNTMYLSLRKQITIDQTLIIYLKMIGAVHITAEISFFEYIIHALHETGKSFPEIVNHFNKFVAEIIARVPSEFNHPGCGITNSAFNYIISIKHNKIDVFLESLLSLGFPSNSLAYHFLIAPLQIFERFPSTNLPRLSRTCFESFYPPVELEDELVKRYELTSSNNSRRMGYAQQLTGQSDSTYNPISSLEQMVENIPSAPVNTALQVNQFEREPLPPQNIPNRQNVPSATNVLSSESQQTQQPPQQQQQQHEQGLTYAKFAKNKKSQGPKYTSTPKRKTTLPVKVLQNMESSEPATAPTYASVLQSSPKRKPIAPTQINIDPAPKPKKGPKPRPARVAPRFARYYVGRKQYPEPDPPFLQPSRPSKKEQNQHLDIKQEVDAEELKCPPGLEQSHPPKSNLEIKGVVKKVNCPPGFERFHQQNSQVEIKEERIEKISCPPGFENFRRYTMPFQHAKIQNIENTQNPFSYLPNNSEHCKSQQDTFFNDSSSASLAPMTFDFLDDKDKGSF